MPLTLCPKLVSDNIAANCDNPIYEGMEEIGYLINFQDLASVAYDANNSHIVTGITLATGMKAYKVYDVSKVPMDGTQSAFAEGDVTNKIDNTVQFRLLDDGPAVAKNVIDGLLNGKFIFIGANVWENANGDNKFQIFGLQKGLKMTGLTRANTTADNNGGHLVTLTETGAPSYGYYIFDTDVTTTRAALEALC